MNFVKKNIKKFILFFLLILVGYFVYNRFKPKVDSQTIFVPNQDQIIKVENRKIQDILTLTGSIDADKKVNLSFQTAGELSWIGVKVGDRVKKFQSIASLNQTALKKQLQVDFNNYRTVFSQFQDTQDKYEKEKENVTLTDDMKRILERSQYSLDNAVIAYELNDLAIKYATLRTPISGIVTNVTQPSAGINVTPTNASFSIIDPSSIYFKANVDQEDVINLNLKNKVEIRLDSFPENSFDSEITYIAFTPVAGEASTVYEVRFKLSSDNSNMLYRLGMDGDANIVLSESGDALVIPLEAVYENENGQYVLVKINNNKLEKKFIKTGIETDTEIEIIEGLASNEEIVIKK